MTVEWMKTSGNGLKWNDLSEKRYSKVYSGFTAHQQFDLIYFRKNEKCITQER